MRLGDLDALKEDFERLGYTYRVTDIIDNAPTVETPCNDCCADTYRDGYEKGKADARPQGEWIIKTGVVSNYSACSLCDFADYRHLHFNYCPGCGARMSFGGKLCGGES